MTIDELNIAFTQLLSQFQALQTSLGRIKISEFPTTSLLNDIDFYTILQGGVNKKVSHQTLISGILVNQKNYRFLYHEASNPFDEFNYATSGTEDTIALNYRGHSGTNGINWYEFHKGLANGQLASIRVKNIEVQGTITGYVTAQQLAQEISDVKTYIDNAINVLKGNAPAEGDTLEKLYNLIIGISNADREFDNIADRDAHKNELKSGEAVLVKDASADPTVDSGWAIYRYNATLGTFIKLAEQESMDMDLAKYLRKDDNLASVQDKAAARNNLGVPSGTEVNTQITNIANELRGGIDENYDNLKKLYDWIVIQLQNKASKTELTNAINGVIGGETQYNTLKKIVDWVRIEAYSPIMKATILGLETLVSVDFNNTNYYVEIVKYISGGVTVKSGIKITEKTPQQFKITVPSRFQTGTMYFRISTIVNATTL